MSKAEDIKGARIRGLMDDMGWRFIHFKGATLMSGAETRGFVSFDERLFGQLVQQQTFGTNETTTKDLGKTIQTLAPDWSHLDRYIAFGDQVWDMRTLDFAPTQLEWVYSTDIALQAQGSDGYRAAQEFFLQLSKGDRELAYDYQQAAAPLFMKDRPTGVIWFVGDGANGKSAYIKALYAGFAQYLVSMTTAAIEDGRDSLMLRGKLGNIVSEASEARVEDTQRYKSIGTHEKFTVHEFNKQTGAVIDADFHTIFNANNIPVFSDKTKGARRRTLTVPFPAHFVDNPTFERDTFTPEFLGGMYTLLIEAAQDIHRNGNRYRWSAQTAAMKQSYDNEVNSAEAFLAHLIDSKIEGFMNYTRLYMNYENWCSADGLIPLGKTALRRIMSNEAGAVRRTFRVDGKVSNYYFFSSAGDDNLVWLDNGYGLPTPAEEVVVAAQRLDDGW